MVVRTFVAVFLVLCVAGAGVAHAIESGDPRADAHDGVVTTCRSAGLPGEIVQATAQVGETVNITAAPAGYQLTGVIVRGARAYNKYTFLGDLPWTGLKAPVGSPAIVGWFACGKPRGAMPTTTTTTTTTSTTTTTTTSSSTTTVPTTTSSTTVAQPKNDSGLAATGFGGGVLVLIGGGLLVGGAAVLVLARRRRA